MCMFAGVLVQSYLEHPPAPIRRNVRVPIAQVVQVSLHWKADNAVYESHLTGNVNSKSYAAPTQFLGAYLLQAPY